MSLAGPLRRGSARHYRLGEPPGGAVIHATRDFTVKTVQKAADLAMREQYAPTRTQPAATG